MPAAKGMLQILIYGFQANERVAQPLLQVHSCQMPVEPRVTLPEGCIDRHLHADRVFMS
jgi:hypothetical protein